MSVIIEQLYSFYMYKAQLHKKFKSCVQLYIAKRYLSQRVIS